ncbi:hypothetical protein NMY22_g20321 [Coprinellus aureogranulatus]|nr:hypothetical protein NMY22_g20321 [Coprinellus aureogranulatus]
MVRLILEGRSNGMTESLSVFADEVTRVAREVGTEGRLGGQARVTNVGGNAKDGACKRGWLERRLRVAGDSGKGSRIEFCSE